MRAQTQIDFLTGATVFLLATLAAFTVAPTFVTPFERPGGQGVVVADGAATRLVTDVLTTSSEQYVLDEDEVSSFFGKGLDHARDVLGVGSTWMLNVTLESGSDRWTLGPTPPDRADTVSTAWRVASLNDTRSTIRVRVW